MSDLVDDSGIGLDDECIDSAIGDATSDTPRANNVWLSTDSLLVWKVQLNSSVRAIVSRSSCAHAAEARGLETLCDSQGKQRYPPANHVAADDSDDCIPESSHIVRVPEGHTLH